MKTDEECWPWTGCKDKDGYGKFRLGDKPCMRVSRIIYKLIHRKDPGKFNVCHVCDNPPCSNPMHLFLGTHLDNMRDRHVKGRYTIPNGNQAY